jgi:hypothetical protein
MSGSLVSAFCYNSLISLEEQVDGWTIQKRRLVAKKKFLLGLGVYHPDETIKRFSRIFSNKFRSKVDCSHRLFSLPYWQGNKLKPWKRLLDLAFHAIADHMGTYETSRDSWHTSAINRHSHISNFSPHEYRRDLIKR